MSAEGIDLLMCGQLGTGCTEIAQIIASRMNMVLFNTEKLLHHLAADLELSFAELAKKARSGEVSLDESLSGLVSTFLRDRHLENVVVEGRTAFMVFLQPATLKVLLTAPPYVRAHHISERRGVSFEQANEHIRISDDDRSNLVRRLWKIDWLDPTFYDLAVNTGAWSYEQAATMIEAVLKARRSGKEG